MKEVKGDIFTCRQRSGGTVVIPTNGDVNKLGRAVMGRGLALQMARGYPGIDGYLGVAIRYDGNHVHYLRQYGMFSFPVKRHFYDTANFDLITQSCLELVDKVTELEDELGEVYVPRVGCGNGKLDWKDVKPLLERLLTLDCFVLVHPPGAAE